MPCVDTNFLIDLSKGEPKSVEKLEGMQSKGEVVYTTTISAAEYYQGAYRSRNKGEAVAKAKSLLNLFVLLTLDNESARLWGQLSDELKSNKIGDLDMLIASIVIASNQQLITRNVKHFERVPGLAVESW